VRDLRNAWKLCDYRQEGSNTADISRVRGENEMSCSKWMRSSITIALTIATMGAATFTTGRVVQSKESQNQTTSPSVPSKTAPLSPVPVPGLLAQPRSLEQLGLPALQTKAEVPADNPQSPQKIALGEKLFFDARLSVDGTVACASCHNPDRAFTDGRPTSVGVYGRVGQRNAPTVLNASTMRCSSGMAVPRHLKSKPDFRSSIQVKWANLI
jgi:mono/diheme cytochrome c family protein